MSCRLTHTEGRWLQILRQLPVLEPEPDIRQWVEAQRIPIKATHNRQAAADGRCWAFADFPIHADWIFDFIKSPTSRVQFRDGSIREVRNRVATVLKDAQSGVTSVALHALAWWIIWRGGNVIMITASRDMARDSGKDKFDLLDQYPLLRDSKSDTSTALAVRYPKSIVWLGGGQSAGSVISNPCSLAIADECAKHGKVDEMIPLDLLKGRLTADSSGKLLAFSTPDNVVEFHVNATTGRQEPIITPETAIHSSWLQGTQEVVEVPCPHCGFYQELDRFRLRFDHCKTSLPDEKGVLGKPIWDRERVVRETWYQCANPDCTDRHADGTMRGRIEEHHKRDMVQARRIIATNYGHEAGHRSLKAGGMLNIAFATRTFGAIADAFLTAQSKGGESALKAFVTDVIGEPFSRYQVKEDNLDAVRKLKRGYRRLSYDGKPTLKVPLDTEAIRFIGLTADVQRTPGLAVGEIGAIKWLIFAAGMDCQCHVLDWGTVPALETLTDLIESKVFCSKDEPNDHHLTVDIVCIDTGYAKEKVYAFLANEGGSRSVPRWCGVRGRATDNEAALRGRPRITKEWPARDKLNNPTVLRVVNVRADHWEAELHIERIAKPAAALTDKTVHANAPAVNLPSDVDEPFLEELANAEQFFDRPNKGNVRILKWRKRHHDRPNDHADNLRNALTVIDAVEEERTTGKAQL